MLVAALACPTRDATAAGDAASTSVGHSQDESADPGKAPKTRKKEQSPVAAPPKPASGAAESGPTKSAPAATTPAPTVATKGTASNEESANNVIRVESTIVITEIMYNPASDEGKGQPEWVEIANLGAVAVEISDWRLDDEDSLPFDQWGPFSCVLAPGGVAVLVNATAVDEAQFRAAWDAAVAADDAAPDAAPDAAGSTSLPASATSGSGATPSAVDPGDVGKTPYLVIPVKWGGISNNPGPRDGVGNEVLQLRDADGRVRCEVNLRNGDGWPKLTAAGGPSVYLAEPSGDLNDGARWRAAAPGIDGARACLPTAVFNGRDIGSPGRLPAKLLGDLRRVSAERPGANPKSGLNAGSAAGAAADNAATPNSPRPSSATGSRTPVVPAAPRAFGGVEAARRSN